MADPFHDFPLTVPVLIDDLGHESTQSERMPPLVRCIYFTFDALQPTPNWRLGLPELTIPFFMLGLSGIVLGVSTSDGQNVFFRSPSDIEVTFDSIERTGSMIVETGRIYLPREFVERKSGQERQEHDVLRLRADLFVGAFAFAHATLSEGGFLRRLDSYESQEERNSPILLSFSLIETKAFSRWSREHFGIARERERAWASDEEMPPEINSPQTPF